MVLPIRLFGHGDVGHHDQTHLVGGVGGVGKVFDVISTIIVETVVAELTDKTILLTGEVERGELRAFADVCLLLRGTEDAVLNAVTESISDAVEEVRFSQMDVVGNTLFLGVTLGEEFIIHMSTEIAVVLQEVGRDLGTGVR